MQKYFSFKFRSKIEMETDREEKIKKYRIRKIFKMECNEEYYATSTLSSIHPSTLSEKTNLTTKLISNHNLMTYRFTNSNKNKNKSAKNRNEKKEREYENKANGSSWTRSLTKPHVCKHSGIRRVKYFLRSL